MKELEHYHIRWLPTGKLDWQRFDQADEAEKSAKALLLRGESYALEHMEGECNLCDSAADRIGRAASPNKSKVRIATSKHYSTMG